MARADSSPKAIIKAAIRTKCHVVARRYEHQRLERLHGSNVKWLVLSDELFNEVCSDFTIRKLDISRSQKRALFDTEWVSQVTYELITKPARPRRGRQQSAMDNSTSPSSDSVINVEARRGSSQTSDSRATLSFRQPTGYQPMHYEHANEYFHGASRHDSIISVDPSLLPSAHVKTPPASPGTMSRPGWFDTILN